MEARLAEYEGVVQGMARRYHWPTVAVDDLLQVARLAVLKALAAYNPSIGTEKGYVTACVRNALYDHVRSTHGTIRVPSGLYGKVWRDCCSLDAPTFDDGTSTLADVLPAEVNEDLLPEDLELVRHAVERLPESYRAVVSGLFLEGRTMRELAEERRCSFQNIQFISKRALLRLRQVSVLRELMEGRAA